MAIGSVLMDPEDHHILGEDAASLCSNPVGIDQAGCEPRSCVMIPSSVGTGLFWVKTEVGKTMCRLTTIFPPF